MLATKSGKLQKNMRVLILANHLNYGGITAYILNLSGALRKKEGFEVYIGSRGGDTENILREMGLKHIRLPLTTKCEVSPKVFLSLLKLIKFVKNSSIDIIHANTRVTQVLAALLSFFTGKPYISTCHGYFRVRISRRLFSCWGLKVIAISDQVRDHLIGDFCLKPERVELIYNGVDLGKFRPFTQEEIGSAKKNFGLDPNKKVIGHIGRLSSVKGQKFLIFAAEEIIRKRKDVQFLIIGDGDEGKNLRELVKDRMLGEVVFICPSVPDTPLALSAMDVFVMPSLQEGLGISILEAQAQGIPVAASAVGGIPTIVQDKQTGLLFTAGDIDSLVSAILRLLDDRNLRDSLVNKAKMQASEKFSLSLMAEKTYNLYKSLVC